MVVTGLGLLLGGLPSMGIPAMGLMVAIFALTFVASMAESGAKFKPTLILAAVLTVWLWPLRTVPTGHRGVVTVGGAIKGIEGEGFTLLAPWQALSIFNIRAESADVKDAEGSTIDTQPVKVSLTVRYSIQPEKVAEVFEKYSRDGNLDSYVETATMEVFKAVTARYTAPELIAKRPQVSSDISAALRVKIAQYGAQVINIDMKNFSFSAPYMAAINEKVTQEQLRLGAENKLKTVEAEQKQKVAVAEAINGMVRPWYVLSQPSVPTTLVWSCRASVSFSTGLTMWLYASVCFCSAMVSA